MTRRLLSLGGVCAFTLLEMLVSVSIVGVLGALGFHGWKIYHGLATRAVCSSNLRQLGAATHMYVNEHNGNFPAYVQKNSDGSRTWYFGHESTPEGAAEGSRDLDLTRGPLYSYIEDIGKIEVCAGFNYASSLWKPKFRGASYGYGYNWILGGRYGGVPMNINSLSSDSRVILYGDCAQVNTFQAPASASHPMVEEFYVLNETDKTVHFRHDGRANILFVDGHVEAMAPYGIPTRFRGEIVGRVTARGMTWLK